MTKKDNIEEISAFEQFIADAKESKHTEAIMLVWENKPKVQEKVIKLLNSEKMKDMPEVVKKAFWLVAELVYQETLSILVDDKK